MSRSLLFAALGAALLVVVATAQTLSARPTTPAVHAGVFDAQVGALLRALGSGPVVAGPCLVDETSPGGTSFDMVDANGATVTRVLTVINFGSGTIEVRHPGVSTVLGAIPGGRSAAVELTGDGLTWRSHTNDPATFVWVLREP